MIFTALASLTLITAVLAAVYDFRQMRLPNPFILVMLGGFALASLAPDTLITSLAPHIIAGGIIFVLTAIMFATRTLGAGDAKMASALALWVGLEGLPIFMLVMSVTGFFLALAALAFRKANKTTGFYPAIPAGLRPENGWLERLHRGENALPYGIAIAAGAAAAFVALGYTPFL